MGWHPIQLGYLMKDEESKKTNLGSKINEAKKAYHYGKYKQCCITMQVSYFERYTHVLIFLFIH